MSVALLRLRTRILVADDHALIRAAVRGLLTRLGFEVDVGCDGREALEAIARKPYDAVFLDLQMPIMGGLEVASRLDRDRSRGRRPWLIALTADAAPEDRAACLAAGMDDLVAKPVRVEELARALARAPVVGDDEVGPAGWADPEFDAAWPGTVRRPMGLGVLP